MSAEERAIETVLRQAAAWERFEQKKDALRERLLAQAAAVAPSWWQRLVGSIIGERKWVAVPVVARTKGKTEDKAEKGLDKLIATLEGQEGLTGELRQTEHGDIHLHLRAEGECWQEAEALRIEYRSNPDDAPEAGAICLRPIEGGAAYVAQVNLGQVGPGVGVEVRAVRWSDVTPEEAEWAVGRAVGEPMLQAWEEGWQRHRTAPGSDTADP